MPTSSSKRSIQKTSRFSRDLRRLDLAIREVAFGVANQLAQNIFDPRLDIKPLSGFRGKYRVVVIRDYRMVFSFDDESVYLLRIGHRREIYRNLEL